MRRVRVGDVLELRRTQVTVEPENEYRTLGIFNRGRGAFERPVVRGADTKYRTLYQVHSGQLIFSKLFAWEGSIAIVNEAHDGCLVSPEFPSYEVDSEKVDTTYLWHVVTWDGFTESLARGTTGMGQRRQRVSPDAFEAITIPLPDLAEQRRIAGHLDKLASATARVATASLTTVRNASTAMEKLLAPLEDNVRIGDILVRDREWIELKDDVSYETVGVRGFGRGIIRYPKTPRAELSKLRYFKLRSERILVSNIKAWEGAVALTCDGDIDRVASNRFLQYVGAKDFVRLDYLYRFFTSTRGVAKLSQASPGSADRNRTLSMAAFEELKVPFPDLERQQQIIVTGQRMDRIRSLADRRDRMAAALLPAARNEIFSAMR